jgi:hypothetical protein
MGSSDPRVSQRCQPSRNRGDQRGTTRQGARLTAYMASSFTGTDKRRDAPVQIFIATFGG